MSHADDRLSVLKSTGFSPYSSLAKPLGFSPRGNAVHWTKPLQALTIYTIIETPHEQTVNFPHHFRATSLITSSVIAFTSASRSAIPGLPVPDSHAFGTNAIEP